MERAAAREPPRATGGEEQIVEAITVEVADAILAEGVLVDRVVLQPHPGLVLGDGAALGLREDVVRQVGAHRWRTAKLEIVSTRVLEGIAGDEVSLASGSGIAIAGPAVVGSVDVEHVGLPGDPGGALVMATALEHEVLVRPVPRAGRPFGRSDRVAIEVEHVVLDVCLAAIRDDDAVA
ncbi:MAG: hypothetical protein WKG01_41635, partial [Kofleriaceae bacterium]